MTDRPRPETAPETPGPPPPPAVLAGHLKNKNRRSKKNVSFFSFQGDKHLQSFSFAYEHLTKLVLQRYIDLLYIQLDRDIKPFQDLVLQLQYLQLHE